MSEAGQTWNQAQPWTVMLYTNTRHDSSYVAYIKDAPTRQRAIRLAIDELREVCKRDGVSYKVSRWQVRLAIRGWPEGIFSVTQRATYYLEN